MYVKLEYLNDEGTIIRATRSDGSILIVEPASGDLFDILKSGQMGGVSPCVPKPVAEIPEEEPSRPEVGIFRIAQAAAVAVSKGKTSLTDAEIMEILYPTPDYEADHGQE